MGAQNFFNGEGQKMTIEIIILTAPGCTTCDQAKAVVQKIVEQSGGEFPDLSYRTVDVLASPEIGARYGVLSTPSIIINDELVFRGVPQEKDLRKKLQSI